MLPRAFTPPLPAGGFASTPAVGLLRFLLFSQKFWHWISKLAQIKRKGIHEATFQIRASVREPCPSHQLLSARGAAAVQRRALILCEVRKSLHSCHFQFLPKQNTSYKESAHYSWIINEDWYFCEVQIGGILHIVRIPILFSWYVVPSAARRPRRCGHSPEITSALHYCYHISIIYTLSDKWKCFHKNNLESWLKTQVCCQGKQSSLKEDLFLFCSDKYVVSGL